MYEISLDRDACVGVFACLVRDDRFAEADDGLATLPDAAVRTDAESNPQSSDGSETSDTTDEPDTIVARFDDDRIEDARAAAAACPFDAIEVREVS